MYSIDLIWVGFWTVMILVMFKPVIEAQCRRVGWRPRYRPCIMVQLSDIVAAEFERPWWEGGAPPR